MFEESSEPPQEPMGSGAPAEPIASDPPDPPPPDSGEPASPEPRLDDGDGGEAGPEPAEEPDGEDEPVFDPFVQLDGAQQRWQRAGAERVVSLLDAYEVVMGDLVPVFGEGAEDRNGPFVRSFLLEAAQVLHLSERAAGTMLDGAQALRRSFPKSWAVFLDGRITWREAELVWRQAQGLDPERVPEYDDAAAEVLGRVPVTRLTDQLHRLRERLQAGTARERHKAAMKDRCTRVEPAPDGMGTYTLYGAAAQLLALDDAVTKAAVEAHGVEGETRTLAQLRYDIALDLLLEGIKQPADEERTELRVPGRKGVQPTVYLTIPVLTLLGRTAEPAELAGYGPIDLETAKELAGEATGWIRILTDPVTGVRLSMDRRVYTPPPDLRWLRVRDETCRAPGCNRRVATCDIDHVSGWIEDGKTEDGNLAHLCRRHHQLKGSGYWRTTLQADARMRWRSWWDRRYVTEPADQPEPVRFVDPPGTAARA